MLNTYFSVLAAATANTADSQAAATSQLVSSIVMLVVIMAIFYFMLIRPQKKKDKAVKDMLANLKKDKEQKQMRDSLQVGDQVTTIGGIVGFIVRKNDDTVVIETGGDRSKIIVKTWAISENQTQHDEQDELGKKK